MYKVGDIIKFLTTNVIGKDEAYKYHLCICSNNKLYLYVCGKGFPGDFPISNKECNNLEYDLSYVSLSRAIHVPDKEFRGKSPELTCTVSDSFIRELWKHVKESKKISDRDRKNILQGIERHYQDLANQQDEDV